MMIGECVKIKYNSDFRWSDVPDGSEGFIAKIFWYDKHLAVRFDMEHKSFLRWFRFEEVEVSYD